MWFELEEIGLAAELDVLQVSPATPEIIDGPGRLVLSTTKTYMPEVIELSFVGSDKPVITTTGHRFFSSDRCDWVQAAALYPGESVETLGGGSSQLVSSTLITEPQWVYNIEVDTDHSYFVGDLGLLVHNMNGPCAAGTRPPNMSPEGAGRRGAFREAKRNSDIPVSQQPSSVTRNVDKQGRPTQGRQYNFDTENGPKTIRDDAGGHTYPDDSSQNRGSHFNDPQGNHYDYDN